MGNYFVLTPLRDRSRIRMDQKSRALKPAYNLDPIFILGARPRSGTNFLCNLLALHPVIGNGRVVWEDFMLADSDLLTQYAHRTYNRWPQHWEVRENVGSWEVICEHIGSGLVSYLNECAARKGFGQVGSNVKDPEKIKMLVTKTPTVKNIGNFFNFFPNAHLIVVVRDGRSVAESGARTFGLNYETAIRRWDEEINTVIQYDAKIRQEGIDRKLLIVRFEDLFRNTKKELEKIFTFLGVRADEYDFEAAKNLPVSGSSTMADDGSGSGKVNWDFKTKEKNFNPLARYESWGRAKHERFNWLVRDESLVYFGYHKKNYDTHRHLWTCWNIIMDRFWKVPIYLKSLKKLISR
jgi:protein-tyrosine sulfotransferase